MDKTIKLILSYHKPDYLFRDSVLTPVHAGRANALHRMPENDDRLKWMLENTRGDDTGENISDQNDMFNEMTSVYWAWKNYESLDEPDYIGFMHYRRHFIFDDKMEKAIYECEDINEDYLRHIKYDEQKVVKIMDDCDFVCVKPQRRKSLYEHFRINHEIIDLDTVIDILKERYPQYIPAAEKYLSGQDAYFCNMFIFPKNLFFAYAAWFFDIVFELVSRIDFTSKRLFVSEWLTGIFITYLIMSGKKGKFLPMIFAEGKHEIPIVFASDNGYAYPMLVAMASLLRYAKVNTSYHFYLLVSGDFSEENKKIIACLCERYPKNQCRFIDMADAFADAKIFIKHITAATYYRLKLPSILKEIGKCIYLDVDVIVKGDLSGLYRTCIDDKYLAGVRALGYLQSNKKIAEKLKELGIGSMDEYVNAGVLLMNLDKMRKDHLEEKFEQLLDRQFESQDQDILNTACYGKIRLLPFQFNVMTKYPIASDDVYDQIAYFQHWIRKDEWDFGRKHPTIIHYADKNKPWADLSSYYANDWWEIVSTLDADTAICIWSQYREQFIQNAYETEQLRQLMVVQRNDLHEKINRMIENKQGSLILRISGKTRGVVRCAKEHGVGYTVRLCIRKIFEERKR